MSDVVNITGCSLKKSWKGQGSRTFEKKKRAKQLNKTNKRHFFFVVRSHQLIKSTTYLRTMSIHVLSSLYFLMILFFYGMLSTPYSVENWYGVWFLPSIYFSPCLWPPKLRLNALSSVSLWICVCFSFFEDILFCFLKSTIVLFSWSRGFHLFDTKLEFSRLCLIRLVFSWWDMIHAFIKLSRNERSQVCYL